MRRGQFAPFFEYLEMAYGNGKAQVHMGRRQAGEEFFGHGKGRGIAVSDVLHDDGGSAFVLLNDPVNDRDMIAERVAVPRQADTQIPFAGFEQGCLVFDETFRAGLVAFGSTQERIGIGIGQNVVGANGEAARLVHEECIRRGMAWHKVGIESQGVPLVFEEVVELKGFGESTEPIVE